MTTDLIYLDNHATTRCDPRVVEAMLPLLSENYGNPHSVTHQAGRLAAELVDTHLKSFASCLGANAEDFVITSGATESNNLALFGCLLHPRNKRRHIVTVGTEHPAVLDPIRHFEAHGFSVTRLSVVQQGAMDAGRVNLEQLTSALTEDTALVSIMMANGEIGVLQPMAQIAEICHQKGALLHTDAAQAVGHLPINVNALGVDLLSVSAHKFYGPKGVGALYVRSSPRRVRLMPQIMGGGQQRNLRSGTLNPAAIVGMNVALQICEQQRSSDNARIQSLRERLWRGLSNRIVGLQLNGPVLDGPVLDGPVLDGPVLDSELRLGGNLNLCFPKVEGESLMIAVPSVAVSSGSACSSAEPKPSSVLMAIGLDESSARRSLRFGLGRFNTEHEIDLTIERIAEAYARLARLVE